MVPFREKPSPSGHEMFVYVHGSFAAPEDSSMSWSVRPWLLFIVQRIVRDASAPGMTSGKSAATGRETDRDRVAIHRTTNITSMTKRAGLLGAALRPRASMGLSDRVLPCSRPEILYLSLAEASAGSGDATIRRSLLNDCARGASNSMA